MCVVKSGTILYRITRQEHEQRPDVIHEHTRPLTVSEKETLMKKKKGPSHATKKKIKTKAPMRKKKKVSSRVTVDKVEVVDAPKQPKPATSQPEPRIETPAPADLPKHALRKVSAELGLKLPTIQPKYGSLYIALYLTFDVEDATIDDALRLHEHANSILANHLLSAQLIVAKEFGVDTGVTPEELFNG